MFRVRVLGHIFPEIEAKNRELTRSRYLWARFGPSAVTPGSKAAHISGMTAMSIDLPASAPRPVHSLGAINDLRPGAILTLGTICALRTETGWLIAGARKERPTWSLISQAGTTSGSVLREGL